MDKLIEYVCDELKELEKKADKDGKLSMAEIQYADTLAHMKKNLLKGEEMYEDEYSMARGGGGRGGRGGSSRAGSYRGGSYEGSYEGGGYSGESYARGRGRGARRDSMGRYSSEGYSRDSGEFMDELHELMESAPNDRVRQKLKGIMSEM